MPSRIFSVHTLASSDEPISSAMRFSRSPVGRKLDDHFAPHLAEGERHLGHEQRRVEAVGGFTADQAGLEDAALDRACGARRAGEQRVGEGGGDAERGGATKEIAPAQFADSDTAAQKFEFVGH